jgi:hypothetical protein
VDNIDVRLGGIHTLRQVAAASSSQEIPVVAVLASYICEHSPWPPSSEADYAEDFPLSDIPPMRFRAPDIQAALDGIGSLKKRSQALVALIGADLRRAAIQGYFRGAYFSGSNLARAVFAADTDLRGTILTDVNFEEARNLDDCRLKGAIASPATKWPAGLDPSAKEVTIRDPTSTFGIRVRQAK